MSYVIRFGKRLYLSKHADYVNNMTHLDIRVFKSEDKSLAINIAKDIGGKVVPFNPKKVRKQQMKQNYQFTNYELDHLLILKKDEQYYTDEMTLTSHLRNEHVLKLTLEQIEKIVKRYSDDKIKVVQLRHEIENKRSKEKVSHGYYIVETRYRHYLTNDYKEVDKIKGTNVKKYDLELGKSLAYRDARTYGGKVKKVYRGRIVKKKFYRKKFLRGRARLIT